MVLLKGFHWWMSNHDSFMDDNQVAYAENVFLRDPEFVSLGQKSENVALTSSDLVLCKLDSTRYGYTYFWSDGGKMYDVGNNVVNCTTSLWEAIFNIVYLNGYVYRSHGQNKIGRIDDLEMKWGGSWSSGNLEAQATYNESYNTGSSITRYLTQGGDIIFTSMASSDTKKLSSWGTVSTIFSSWLSVWLRRTLNYYKTQNIHPWRVLYFDWTNNYANATAWYGGAMLDWFSHEWFEMLVSGIANENMVFFQQNGEGRAILARARLSSPDSKKAFYFGRGRTLNISSATERRKQSGNDVHWGLNNIIYMIAENGILSLGSLYRWLPLSWCMEATKNYNNQAVDEIGMCKVEVNSSTDESWLYYSRKVGSQCGVDRIDLEKINNPDSYWNEWAIYTQKYDFWENKACVGKVKLRAYTTSTQTIELYESIDGGAFTLVATLNGTDPKKYHLITYNREAYTIQWKIVLRTSNASATPKLYAFSFDPKVYANE